MEHRYSNPILSSLPESQRQPRGRHKCAACAYDRGFDDGLAHLEPNFDPSQLDDSQAGAGRHKDCAAAYNKGFYYGLEEHRQSS